MLRRGNNIARQQGHNCGPIGYVQFPGAAPACSMTRYHD